MIIPDNDNDIAAKQMLYNKNVVQQQSINNINKTHTITFRVNDKLNQDIQQARKILKITKDSIALRAFMRVGLRASVILKDMGAFNVNDIAQDEILLSKLSQAQKEKLYNQLRAELGL